MLYDVFLSHNHADKDWTRALREAVPDGLQRPHAARLAG
jgi:hypothetical protein